MSTARSTRAPTPARSFTPRRRPRRPMPAGRTTTPGLGEAMVRRGPSGAVAYIGCNTGGQPCGITLLEGFVGALRDLPEPTLGDCWVRAIDHYYQAEHLETIEAERRLVSAQHLLPGDEVHGLRRPGAAAAGGVG